MIIYNLFFKYFIGINLFLFSFFSLFFSDLIMIWFFMEISNFLFICLLNMSLIYKKFIFLYFFIQIMSSSIIIYIIIMNNLFMMNNYLNFLILMSLFMKLSVPPFHLWLPILSSALPWPLLFLLLTIQKLSPFYMLSLIKLNYFFIYLTLILTCIIPPYMMINNNNLKSLMAYSSINQSGWMIMLIYLKNIIWLKYFMFYLMISLMLFTMIFSFKMSMNSSFSSSTNLNITSIIFMFNLAGMPPFSFFYMKWFSLYLILTNSNMLMILILMMISSLLMLYIYINMMIKSMFLNKISFKLLPFYPNFNYVFWNMLSLFLSLTILII
uniref:NADH dehydrogenase subunit 2 n=1 Tax=Stenamma diecki TaxID=625352 RepID=UPI001FCD1C0E|nr:NADH dehydrogenase subunit 2 [Stenamma diecki]UNZ99527.1 NADH dehydrogenase subunit 2 [Stenamma diecki]